MKLHRTTGKPDWADISASDQNIMQRVAASTKGVITPGNALTVAGFGIVIIGLGYILKQHYWEGGIALAIGRLCDITDGWVADYSGTKSPFGELLDASLDKIGTFLSLAVFYANSVAPRWVLLSLLVPYLIIALIALVAFQQNTRLHPSRTGKLSMAAAWFSLLGYVGMRALNAGSMSIIAVGIGALAIISVALGLYAAYGYASKAVKSGVL